MVADANKSIAEGDPEVSEAVDLARYYARVALGLDGITGARPSPLGPVVVVATVELPARHPGRRCPRRARGRELGHPQACASESFDRCAHRRAVLGRRHRPRCPPARPCRRRRGRAPAHHPPRRRRGDPDRLIRHRPDVPRVAARSPTARRDERQEQHRHHRVRRHRPAPSWISCGLRSATQARSARRRAWPSSRRRSTTAPRSSNVSETLPRASASGPRATSPPRSDHSSIHPAKRFSAH